MNQPNQSTAKAEQELQELIHRLGDALGRRDVPLLESLLANDYTFTTPIGTVLTRAQRIEAVASGRRPVTALHYDELQVRLYSDAAVVTGRYTEQGPNAAPSEQGRLLTVFVRQQGHWRMVAGQNNRIAQPGPELTT